MHIANNATTDLINAIEIEDLSLEIRGVSILSHVNLQIPEGKVISVIGPSGCGKTTLLNIIAGLMPGWEGTANVKGDPIGGPGRDRTVVFQEDAVFPWMSVQDNVEYSLKIRKVPKAERRQIAESTLSMVGLNGYEKTYPRRLSGGQRKRVDLARALVARPEILLMDEPFAALDQMTKQRLQQEFLSMVGRENTTSLFVTHDLEEAIYVGDRIVEMAAKPGRIVQEFTVPFAHPRQPEIRMDADFQELRRQITRAISSHRENSLDSHE